MAKREQVGTAFSVAEKDRVKKSLEDLLKARKAKGRLEVKHFTKGKNQHRWEFWYVED
ncbi:hypothetical protein SEA_SAMISTI12_168 [Streptomyces phage Samisti12]|uniref:Uncharacterized protein n=5 Tax=Samistivirus TaxID=2560220 RepID=A0A223G037_9CAUD|nr:hypothetical protein FDI39_gp125 [Streptomyces phage Samisti12]YP_010101557.1 hypothetical protein KNU49_gp131 [Streptomyces phage EGole]ASR76566.1 hypothetical protein SEA_SUSHI23_166 [Streptomyces phage Sushi23]QAX95871.1 hypothetical protein SEA_TEUTSCH_165 [Streptomyces phage Teutsch]QRI46129.1 hypothetical protein SEA_CROSS_167 [Streptomyces phage Cross]WDS51933.1 hypothetical protein SEA_PEPPERWOOD_166 [Streptomyces phage Pepperwood]WNN95498.1 hypothetical protein SEA_WATERMOORE_166 